MANKENENKVLIGFKCNPSLKLALSRQAGSLGVTLSSYVETMVSAAHENGTVHASVLLAEIKELKEKINFYEDSPLKELYKAHKGEVILFTNRNNKKVSIRIDSIQDAFTVIINSFKNEK